jgi:hypothetical protein
MTTFRRPEMLWWSLHHLSQCDEINDVDVRVWVDNHVTERPNLGIFSVLEHYVALMPNLSWKLFPMTPHPDMGPVTLTALGDAYRAGAKVVMVVEEDVIVSPDFIRWSRAANETAHPFCSMGIVPAEIEKTDDPTQIGLGPWFCAWGCSFPRESIPAIVEHNVHAYHGNQHPYLSQKFPGWEAQGGAWDGLMVRLLGVGGRKCAFPTMPRAANIGVYGHFRTRECMLDATTLKGRIEEMGKRMWDTEWLRSKAPDCSPLNLDIPAWSELKLVA